MSKKVKTKLPKLKTGLSFSELQEMATDKLFDLIEAKLPKEEVIEQAVESLVKYVDEQIEYPGVVGKVIDAFDHVVAKAIIMLLVHEIYDDIHTEITEAASKFVDDDGA